MILPVTKHFANFEGFRIYPPSSLVVNRILAFRVEFGQLGGRSSLSERPQRLVLREEAHLREAV